MRMTDEPLTLSELAERTGVEMRTLRSWIQQGLVPGPDSVGRNARYASAALIRARAVKAMRDIYGLPLSSIRQDLLAADEKRIAAYAAMAGPAAAPPGGPGEQLGSPAPAAAPAPSGSTAADYLRGLRSSGVYGAEPPLAGSARIMTSTPNSLASMPEGLLGSAPAPSSGSRLTRLAEGLERIAGVRPSRRKVKGEVRLHIPITPDVELTVRGEHSPEEIARFEQVADLLRVILTGGADHD